MPLNTTGRNLAASTITTAYPWIALYNGDPTAGGTEISGGSPAYARQQGTWSTTNGISSTTVSLQYDVPAGATLSHFALFDAASGGTMCGSGALSSVDGPYGSQGVYTLTAASLTVN